MRGHVNSWVPIIIFQVAFVYIYIYIERERERERILLLRRTLINYFKKHFMK